MVLLMEKNSFKHTISVVHQPSDKLCWRYCGKVLYLFKNGNSGRADFQTKLGKFDHVKSGLTPVDVDKCYKHLGFKKDEVKNLSASLLLRQPVIIGYSRPDGNGHLVLLVGITDNGSLILNDGCLTKENNAYKVGEESVTIQLLNTRTTNAYWY